MPVLCPPLSPCLLYLLTARVPTCCWFCRYYQAADIWAFGILLMELATGHAPYANFSLTNIIIMTMHSPVPELERTFSDVSFLFPFPLLPLHRPCSQGPLPYPCDQAPPLFPSRLPHPCSQATPLFSSPLPHPCSQAPSPQPSSTQGSSPLFPVMTMFASRNPLFHPSTAPFVTLSQQLTHRQKIHKNVCSWLLTSCVSFCNHVACIETQHIWEYHAFGLNRPPISSMNTQTAWLLCHSPSMCNHS